MDKLKQWLKRLWCLIVGCSLADANMEFQYEDRTMMYIVRNRCVRCGRGFTCEVPKEDLLDFEPIRLEANHVQ